MQLIAAEDTRVTMKLLNAFDISTPLTSCHEHNERSKAVQIAERMLAENIDVAVTTDAGTPCISDPGSVLVREATERGIPAVAVSGPTAMASALSVSGMDISEFTFYGFLPRQKNELREKLTDMARHSKIAVVHESPHRVIELLQQVQAVLPHTFVSASCDLTKKFEQTLRGPVEQVLRLLEENPKADKGEYCLCLRWAEEDIPAPETGPGGHFAGSPPVRRPDSRPVPAGKLRRADRPGRTEERRQGRRPPGEGTAGRVTGRTVGRCPTPRLRALPLTDPDIARAMHGRKARVYFQKPCAQHTERRCRRRLLWPARRITRGEWKAPDPRHSAKACTQWRKSCELFVLNGPNLNLLGIREPDIYGRQTFADLEAFIREVCAREHIEVECFQSNHEGALVDIIQSALGKVDGIVINPAAYTHTSVAILDALKAVALPAVEVHLSDVRRAGSLPPHQLSGHGLHRPDQGQGLRRV